MESNIVYIVLVDNRPEAVFDNMNKAYLFVKNRYLDHGPFEIKELNGGYFHVIYNSYCCVEIEAHQLNTF